MKKFLSRKLRVLLAVVVANAVTIVVGIMTNVVSNDVADTLKLAGLDRYRFHITAAVFVAGLVVAAWVYLASSDEKEEVAEDGGPAETDRDRRAFLADLAKRYRERNVHKLDGRYEISLVVSYDLDGTRTRQFDGGLGVDAHASEAVRYIIERFDRQGRLLIAGNPGSGKTVLLLALAQHLAERAREDAGRPLPVIFNLASWSPDHGTFGGWVTAMLTKGYGLSPEFAVQLLEERRIIFLLDGLDELARNEEAARAAEIRAECLASLDRFLYDGTMSAVICCRREQLLDILKREGDGLPVAAIVSVQDLTELQITRALRVAGGTPRDKFAAPHLLETMGRDRGGVYAEVLSTPFYFTTALQVFDSTRPTRLDAPDKETLESNLLAAFVEKKLQVTPNPRHFQPERTLGWLTCLARFLDKKEGVTFELSDLQPYAIRRGRLYRLLFSLACGLSGAILVSLISWGTLLAMPYGIFCSLFGVYLITDNFAQWTLKPLRNLLTWVVIILLATYVAMLASYSLLTWRLNTLELKEAVSDETAGLAIVLGIIAGLLAVIFFVCAFLLGRGVVGMAGSAPLKEIETEDFARWSLSPLLRRRAWLDVLRSGLEAGITGFVALTIITGFAIPILGIQKGLEFVRGAQAMPFLSLVGYTLTLFVIIILVPLFFGLFSVPFGSFIGLLLGLFRACRKVTRFANINSPYQRLRAGVVFNVLQMLCVGVAFFYLIFGFNLLTNRAFRPAMRGYLPELPVVTIFALMGLFRTALFKHAVLRMCLALEGSVPLRYADFLSYATELRILEKDGGQWRFRHQILQDYFARRAQGRGAVTPAPGGDVEQARSGGARAVHGVGA